MVAEIIEISTLAYNKTRFYTIKVEGRRSSEFSDFNHRMQMQQETVKADWKSLQGFLRLIKEKHGAQSTYFDNDRSTEKLPYCCFIEMGKSDPHGIRIYCLRISDTILLVLNGDQRTELHIEDCPNCYTHFEFAKKLDGIFDQAIREGKIRIDVETKTLIKREDFQILL